MEKSFLTQVKAILKSLVLSSTDRMTIDQLNLDYRDIEGEPIPFRRLGYDNIEVFLNSMPDTLRVFGSGPTARVCFVASEKSGHIHDMITKQRKPKTKVRTRKRERRRRSSQPSSTNRFNDKKQPVYTCGQQLSPFQTINRHKAVRTVELWQGPPPLPTNSSKKNTANIQTFCALPQPTGIESTIKDIQKNNLKKYEEHVKQVSDLLKNNCFITQPPPPHVPRPKATKNISETKAQQSVKEVKTEISSERKFSNELNLATFTSSEENSQPTKLPSRLEQLVAMRRKVKFANPFEESSSNTTYEEFEEKKETPKLETNLDLNLPKEVTDIFDINNEKEEQEDEAVPSYAAKHNVFRFDFPEHTVPFGSKISPFEIPNDLQVDDCIKIFVSEIHSPFRFWFHIHKDEHELDLLMFQIERYYSTLDVDDLRIPLTSLMPGQVCAALYNYMWHRAEIVAPPVNNNIKVSFIDYGTVGEIKIEEVKFLTSYFAKLPAQAMRGCLSHIKPRHLHWSHEATLHFLELSSDVMLYAKIAEIDTKNKILYMILCNTSGKEVVQINKSLVQHQYAFYNEDWKTEKITKNNGKRVHHPREEFPTFSMIESGEYPNFTELSNLQGRGIDYEAIYDSIIYNQSSILNKHENVPECIRKLPYFLTTTNPFRTDIVLDLCHSASKTL